VGGGTRPATQGKRENSAGQKGKGKRPRHHLSSNSTWQPDRAHARTKRNDFPVGVTPQPPIMSLLHFVCFVLTVKCQETPRDCEVARSLPVAVSVQLCLATRWTCSMRFGSMSLITCIAILPPILLHATKRYGDQLGSINLLVPWHTCVQGGVGLGRVGPQKYTTFCRSTSSGPTAMG
jgi:hypothetical protein